MPAESTKPVKKAGSATKTRKTKANSATIRVKLVRSMIGSNKRQRAVLNGLGLRKTNQIVERMDTPEIRGMVAKVAHLVTLEEGS